MTDNNLKSVTYIDGQNFIYKAAERLIENGLIKDKQELTKIDIPYLINLFTKTQSEIRYYGVASIRRQPEYGKNILEKSRIFADNLRRIKSCLSNLGVRYKPVGVLKVRESDKCRKCGTTGYKFQEKGVDVGISVDIVRDALENQVDKMILVSLDTDLMPAIKIAKRSNVEIIYVAFENQITQSISRQSSTTQIIHDCDIIEAYRRLNKSKS